MSDPPRQRSTIRGLLRLVIAAGITLFLTRSGPRLLAHCLTLLFALILLVWVTVPIGVSYGQKLIAYPPIAPFDPDSEQTPEFVRLYRSEKGQWQAFWSGDFSRN